MELFLLAEGFHRRLAEKAGLMNWESLGPSGPGLNLLAAKGRPGGHPPPRQEASKTGTGVVPQTGARV